MGLRQLQTYGEFITGKATRPLYGRHPDDLAWNDGTGQNNEHYYEQWDFICKTGTFPPGFEMPRPIWVSVGEYVYEVTRKS